MSKGMLSGSPFHIEYDTSKYVAPCSFRNDDKTCGNATCPLFMHFCFGSWKCIYKNGNGRRPGTAPKKVPALPAPIHSNKNLYIIDDKPEKNRQCPHCESRLLKASFSFSVYSNDAKSEAIGLFETNTQFCPQCKVHYITARTAKFIKKEVKGYAAINYITK